MKILGGVVRRGIAELAGAGAPIRCECHFKTMRRRGERGRGPRALNCFLPSVNDLDNLFAYLAGSLLDARCIYSSKYST